MRILTVIYEFPPVGGGGGRAAYDICKGLAARGHDVTVLTVHMKGLPREETRDGIHLIRIPALRKNAFGAGFFVMLAYILSGFRHGLPLVRSLRPQIMHAHFAVPSGALAWLLSLFTGVPYILTAHLGDVPGGVPEKTDKWFRFIKPFTHPIWNRAKKVIAVSEYTRSLAVKHYRVPIQVIHNGADVSQLAPREIKLNTPPRLIFAGRFVPQKNPLAIVEILAQVKDLNWTCAMLGDGPLLEDVKHAIASHGMSERFTLPGWVTPEDVLEGFSESDILFMPSLSEGLPVVGVQALAKGLAFVVSEIGGFLDIVENEKNGFLIPLEQKEKFASALRKLLTNPDLLKQYRAASLKKAAGFDIEKIVLQYEETLQSLLSNL